MNERSEANGRPLHVVLGAGQIGPRLCDRLLADGHRVRVVRRGEATVTRPGVERVRADLSVASDALRAVEGASVIYDCTNPASYGSWDAILPPLKRSIAGAAARSGALLVSLDNLYMYGPPASGEVLHEASPIRPSSKKGELRARLANELSEASARGDLRVTTGRASDFFGPGAGRMSFFGDGFVRTLARGWGAMVLGDPSLPRSYTYVPDVVAGLAALGARPDLSEGRIFHLPVAWKRGTTIELVRSFASELGVAPRTWRMPRWMFRALGIFSRDLGAVAEMVYQWETPFVVDDTRFRETFGIAATPVELAIRESVRAALPMRPAAQASAEAPAR